MTRQFPDRPIVGVGAVVAGPDGVLLVRRAQAPLIGEWSLPGGAVEVGEALSEAIAREVLEETGLVVRVGPLIDVLDRIHHADDGGVEYHYVLVDYLCYPVGGTLAPASDASEARWASPESLQQFSLGETAVSVIARALELARVNAEAATRNTPAPRGGR